MHRTGKSRHPHIDDLQKRPVHHCILKHLVPLKQEPVILLHSRHILPVHLRKHSIHKPSALITRLADHRHVSRRNHHHRKHPHMLRHLLVELVVALNLLLPLRTHLQRKSARQTIRHTISTSKRKLLGSMSEIELIRRSKGALGHRHIIYGIKKIGLTLTIVTADAVDVWRKIYLLKLNVSEIRNHYLFKYRHI